MGRGRVSGIDGLVRGAESDSQVAPNYGFSLLIFLFTEMVGITHNLDVFPRTELQVS